MSVLLQLGVFLQRGDMIGWHKFLESQQLVCLRGLKFEGGTMEGWSFKFADLQDSEFINVKLSEADFSKSSLTGALFVKCDAMSTCWDGVSARGVRIQRSVISRSSFKKADLGGGLFIGCIARETDFSQANLDKSILQGADFQNAIFTEAMLEKADLRLAEFQGANMKKANLRGALIRGAILASADLTGVDLTETGFSLEEIKSGRNERIV